MSLAISILEIDHNDQSNVRSSVFARMGLSSCASKLVRAHSSLRQLFYRRRIVNDFDYR
jgi:hypothetical protein